MEMVLRAPFWFRVGCDVGGCCCCWVVLLLYYFFINGITIPDANAFIEIGAIRVRPIARAVRRASTLTVYSYSVVLVVEYQTICNAGMQPSIHPSIKMIIPKQGPIVLRFAA